MKSTTNSIKNPIQKLNISLLIAQEKISAQEKLLLEQAAILFKRDQEISALEFRIAKLLAEKYGRRTETFPHPQQNDLFDEAIISREEISIVEALEQEIQVASFTRKKSGRKPLPDFFPREEIIYDLSENEKQCSCGCALTEIGSDKSEQLDIIPAVFKVLVHVRKKYACKACEENVQIAALPVMPIPKSIAAPSLLAHVLVCKYADHLPLYRQENILQRSGVDIARSTMSHWVIKCAALLKPLVTLMRIKINQHDVAYADETTLQVLKEKDRTAESKSYMWYFAGGPIEKRCIVYEYHPTRAAKIAQVFFENYQGYLHCDGYAGYEALFLNEKIIGVGCWAHARRKFAAIVKANKKNPGFAQEALNIMQKVYHLEKIAKEAAYNLEQIQVMRDTRAKPILEDLKARLELKISLASPGSPISDAMKYTLKQWPKLMNYLKDPRLEIDNNASERAIKHFAVGRKNWLFSDSIDGAHAGAIIYSLLETCRAHKVEPFTYFKAVLNKLPTIDNTPEALEALLPFNLISSLDSVPAV